jgi:2-iminobutanoate/2-iminopropanoate deaminase
MYFQKLRIMKTNKCITRFVPVLFLLFIAVFSCCTGGGKETKFYPQENSSYPFSKAVSTGDIIFVSGILGTDKEGHLDPDFKVQSKQVMENIKERVEGIGLSMKDIVKCTVMIRDMSKWADFNEIYKNYFAPDRYPARSAFGVTALALGAEMEVEVICSNNGKK